MSPKKLDCPSHVLGEWRALKPVLNTSGRWVVILDRMCPNCGGGKMLSAEVEHRYGQELEIERQKWLRKSK